jgi:iron complex outermembrane receptor protein
MFMFIIIFAHHLKTILYMNRKTNYEQLPIRFKRFARKGYAAFNSMHKVVNIGVVAGCVLTSMLIDTAHAQTLTEDRRQQVMEEQELDEVMVTASRLETPLSQAAKLVTLITKEQIERAPVQSIQDLLIYAANIDVVQRGGHGVQADISIRGGSFDQNAVLLNGINLSNAHTGHYNFDLPINLSDIERIEIIHGPSALAYGSGSFSGGINIITKKKTSDKLYARMEGGMYALRGIELRSTLPVGIASNSLSAGYDASNGYTANSDYTIYNVLWQTRLALPQEAKVDIQAGYNDKKYGANTFYSAKYPNQYEQTGTYTGAIKGELGGKLKVVPILYWNRHYDRFDLNRGSEAGRNFHRNDTYGGNLILSYHSKAGTSSLGVEWRREEVLSSALGKPLPEPQGYYTKSDERTNTSASLEHTLTWNRWAVSAGIWLNHTSLLKGEYGFYPSAGIVYRPIDRLKLSASWSRSTRMPTFTDLYYTTETHNGNEGLRPEKSESLDAGLKYTNDFMEAYLTSFLLWGRDMIDWVKKDPQDLKWASWNLTKIQTQGLEAGVRLRLAELLPCLGSQSFLSLDYARMHQTSDSQGLLSMYLLNYLRDKFTAGLSHPIYKGLSAHWFFRLQKRMGTYEKFVDLEKAWDVPYPAFSTLDLRLNYTYRALAFNLSLNNLYDTFYFDKGNIPQPGFWLMGGVSYTLQ